MMWLEFSENFGASAMKSQYLNLTLFVLATALLQDTLEIAVLSDDHDAEIIVDELGEDQEEDMPGEPLNPSDFDKIRDSVVVEEPSNITDPLELAGAFEGDIIGIDIQSVNEVDGPKSMLRNAIIKRNQIWPNGVIPYSISRSYSSKERGIIAKAFQEYHKETCITFKPRTHERDYISIFPGRGCYSNVGRSGGEQQVSLGSGCVYVGVAIHELMHAAGFWHEQSRADRDSYITINYGNIIEGLEYNFKKYTWSQIQSLQTSYDTSSIMHYGAYAFAKNRKIPTIVPKVRNSAMGQRKGFSSTDIRKLKKLYQCDGHVTPPTKPSPPPAPQGCKDGHKLCSFWAKKGECANNPSYMKLVCQKSCDSCDMGCSDLNRYCPTWAQQGECVRNSPYMIIFCQKSCNMCGGKKSVSTCQDNNRYCEAWAKGNQCNMNPDWMMSNCPKSCKIC